MVIIIIIIITNTMFYGKIIYCNIPGMAVSIRRDGFWGFELL